MARIAPDPSTAAAPPALEVVGVSHSYGTRKALDDVSFTVPQGSFTALLGPNGAGKSTLFSLVTRLFNVRDGAIRILGQDLAERPGEALRRLGVVFQARTLDLELSIRQNLKYHAALHGISGAAADRRIAEILAGSELLERLGDKARNLSGGQLRRVEIVRAFMHRPRLILLDEPTVGLDIRSRAEIVAEVRRLVMDENVSVLWATHLIDEIDETDRVVVLHHGKVLAEGLVPDVVESESAGSIRDAFSRLTGLASRQPDLEMVS
ncbi:ABC transporter ATP-binding protein [Aurantimonas endophytica]|uniref:ABC-2 type transport system ATP-binding protein n=1 Tax=Aurantimonas endophytica TaxID=1522175 RepID=A0A7W6HE47_9HYPH|nr:ABC transporter ATP-binding protein [Aurantimonas endophytica]MBB4003361.1 ABC-2 type transport system ATP-binding protein [Aurantimonas endophytica]MCO6404222.1 ATP-binding cassette domain-containing protein [Aurantimonas endophytica]